MLEIGNKIYEFQITNLGIKLKLEVAENGYLIEINSGKFNTRKFYAETEELKNLFKKK